MKKALIVRLSSLGDVILTSVVIDPLIKAGYKPFLLTYDPFGEVFRDDSRITVISVKKEKIFDRLFIENLKKENFDLHIDLHRKLKTFILRQKLKGKWIYYKKMSIKRRLGLKFKFLLKGVPPVTQLYLEPVRKLLGVEGDIKPNIKVYEARVSRWKKDLGNDFISVCVGARYKKKVYPYYHKVVDTLSKIGYRVVFVGDEKDRETCKEYKGINLCGRLSLIDTLAVIKASLLFVGNDSGLTHASRAVGTKTIQIFGGTHPLLGFSLLPYEGKIISKNLDCQPCDLHGKGKCKKGNYECLEIEPQIIVSAVEELINGQ